MASARRLTKAVIMPKTVWQVAKFVGVTYCFNKFVGQFIQTQGPSMLPTMNATGDVVFVDKLSHRWKDYERRELVVARSPNNTSDRICKRIIALPGDFVVAGRSNACSLEKREEAARLTGGGMRVPPGHVWLEGDNPHNSTDSRRYGPVPISLLEGRLLARVWPLTQLALYWGPVDEIPRPTEEDRVQGMMDMSVLPAAQLKRHRKPKKPSSSAAAKEGQ